MDLRTLDLNLLVTLDALLRETSVTRAAGELGVSQPAVSASLRRLRRHFDDPLLRRTGNTYALTPLAMQLKEYTGLATHAAQRVFEARPAFDPFDRATRVPGPVIGLRDGRRRRGGRPPP